MKINNEIVVLIGARICQSLLAIVSIRILTSILEPNELGLLGLISALLSFFGLFMVNPFGQYLNRHIHEWFASGELWWKIIMYNKLIVSISLISFCLTLPWTFFYKNYSLIYSLTFSCMIMLCVYTITWNSTLIPMLNMLGFRVRAAYLMLLTTLCSLILSTYFAYLKKTAFLWQAGVLVGSMFVTLGALYSLRDMLKFRILVKKAGFISRQDFFMYCFPIAISTFFMWFISSGYRFFISDFYGDIVLGLIVVSFGLAVQFWNIIDSLVTQVLYPKFYVRLGVCDLADAVHAYKLLINSILPAYIIFIGYSCGIANQMLYLLVDERFWLASHIAIIAMAIEGFRVLTNVFNLSTQIRKVTKLGIYPYVVTCIGVVISALICYKLFLSVEFFMSMLFMAMLSGLVVSFTIAILQFRFFINLKLILYSLLAALLIFLFGRSFNEYDNTYISILVVSFSGILAVSSLYLIVIKREHYRELVGYKLPSDEL